MQYLTGGMGVAFLAAIRTPAVENPGLMQKIGLFLQRNAWPALPLLLIAGSVFGFVARRLGDTPARTALGALLEHMREDVFGEHQEDPSHYHRVTLFRKQTWTWRFMYLDGWRPRFLGWPGGGWLVPVMRSGHTTQKARSRWSVPDAADNAVGIAGWTWNKDGVTAVQKLPCIAEYCDGEPSDADYEIYAVKSHVPEAWARSRRPEQRSLCGFPVKARGKRWGVLVLDSRAPEMDVEAAQAFFRNTAGVLGSLTQGV